MTMQKSKIWTIIVIILILLGGAFYWYAWRPVQIIKSCYRQTIAKENYPDRGQNTYTSEERKNINLNYQDCLKFNGLIIK
jgi:hypothetical protein